MNNSFIQIEYLQIMKMKRLRQRKLFKKKPSNQFKKALQKLKRCKSDKQKFQLIRDSSDDFIQDLAMVIHKCVPIFKPIMSTPAVNKIKSFSKPSSSVKRRRKMIQHGGNSFLGMLKDIGESVYNIASSPAGSTLLTALALL